jgi:hypothetical protein
MRKLTIFFFLLYLQTNMFAQSRSFLPFSVFGVGELSSTGSLRSLGMGRSGIAHSSDRILNNMNPASYYLIDSVSFLFDVGLNSDFVKYQSMGFSQNANDANIRNVAIGFRINNRWTSGVGISPYSKVGYKIHSFEYVEGTTDIVDVESTGSGGINQFYWDNSYKLFKGFSLGINFTYLFGNIKAVEQLTYIDLAFLESVTTDSYLKKVYANFGMQYNFDVKEKWKFTLGSVFSTRHLLNFKQDIIFSDYSPAIEERQPGINGTFRLPMNIGAGFAVKYNDKFTLSADYVYHDWGKTESNDTHYDYVNTHAYKFGFEYVPGNPLKLGYLGRMSFRTGYYFEDFYVKVNQIPMYNQGFTFGVGAPFIQNKTSISMAYNYGIKGTTDGGLIKENYHQLMFSLTLHDWWFIKRIYD